MPGLAAKEDWQNAKRSFSYRIGSNGLIARSDAPSQRTSRHCLEFELFVKQAREARINSEFPTFGLGLFKKAMAAGHAEEEVAVLIKVLREA